MTIKVREIAGSDAGEDSRYEGRSVGVYSVTGSDVIADLKAEVLSVAPATKDGKFLDRVAWDFDEDGSRWIFTIDYSFRPPESTLRWKFDTQGGSIRLTRSLATTRYPSGTAPNFNGAIAVDGGQVQGTDIIIPALRLTASYVWPAGAFGESDIDALADLTGTVNSDVIGTKAAGSMLFLGASGELVPNKPTPIDYHFAVSKNATGLTIGSISGIAKKGHEFLWVLWEEDVDQKRNIKKPLAVYVERVYTEATHSSIGIF